MKLRKLIGLAAAALALSLALCGCGDKKSKSEPQSDSESARSSSQTPGKFSPMVTKDATFALGVNLDKRQAFKVVDAYLDLDQFCSLMQLRDGETAEVKATVAKYKKDLFADAPSQLRDFLDETGLCDTQLRWAVFSLENLKMSDYGPQLYGLSVAIAGNVNLEKLIQTVQKKSSEENTKGGVVFTEMSLEGEKAWRIEPHVVPNVFVLGMTAKMWKEIGLDLHVTSLDDQLILLASSRGALAKQIRLYRQGMAKSDALGGFSAKEGDLLRLKVVDVGERIRETVSQRALQGTVPMIADLDQVIMRLGDIEGDVTVSSDGMVSVSASLKAASEEDADKIRALAKVGLMAARSQWSEDPYVSKECVEMLDTVKIGGADGEIKVQGVDPLFAFGPVAASARLSSDLLTMAMNGRKLLMGIIQANIDRPDGLPALWPRTWQEKDASNASSDDVSARAYRSAADYFNALFDMEHYGTTEWDPSVDGELLSTLGKNAVVRKGRGWTIDPAGLDWCIAANITIEDEDFLPVLISANVNPELLYGDQFDGRDDSPLPIGRKSGAPKSMFGDQGLVLVRKSSAAETFKVKYARYAYIYNRQSFDNSGREHPTVWLTPTGVAVPGKGKTASKKAFGK